MWLPTDPLTQIQRAIVEQLTQAHKIRRRKDARRRRKRLRLLGRCINGRRHPRPKPGHDKCNACVEQHRSSRDAWKNKPAAVVPDASMEHG